MVLARIILVFSLLVSVASFAHGDVMAGGDVGPHEAHDMIAASESGHGAPDHRHHSDGPGEIESPLHCGGAVVVAEIATVENAREAVVLPNEFTSTSRPGADPSPRHPPPRA